MFSRFSSLLKEAVDAVVTPAALKSKSEAMLEHWQHVAGFFHDQRDKNISSIDETNIPFHLECILKYVKEEELEQIDDEGLTGPCLEALLQRRILDSLVNWAIVDKPFGIFCVVLTTFALLISNIHHRLLPESAVRIPLLRLIESAHNLREHSTLTRVKVELMRLVSVVFTQLRNNPALINLFIEYPPQKSRTSQSNQIEINFPLFSYLEAYLMSESEELASISRETTFIAVETLLKNQQLADFLLSQSTFTYFLVENLRLLHGRAISLSLDKEHSSGHEKEIGKFYQHWDFVNNILLETSPISYANRNSQLHENFYRHITSKLLDQFIAKEVCLPLLSKSIGKDEWRVRVESFSVLVSMMSSVSFIEDCFKRLCDIENGSLMQLFAQKIISKDDNVSIATLKLYNSFLGLYCQGFYRHLIRSNLEYDSAGNIDEQMESSITRLSTLFQERRLQKLYKNMANDDGEVYFNEAADRQDSASLAYQVWSRSQNEDESSLSAPINFLDILLAKMESFFSNSPTLNLILSSLFSKLSSIPDVAVLRWFLESEDGSTSSEQPSSPLNETPKRFFNLIATHDNSISQRIEEIVDFEKRLDALFKQSTDDDILSQLITNISNANDDNDIKFTRLIRSYMILTEMTKELCAGLLLTLRTIGIQKSLEDHLRNAASSVARTQ